MRPIAPRTGAPETTYAEEQQEYQPLTVATYVYSDGPIGLLTRWQPTPAERAAIAAGEDIYVMQLRPDTLLTPQIVQVGPGGFTLGVNG